MLRLISIVQLVFLTLAICSSEVVARDLLPAACTCCECTSDEGASDEGCGCVLQEAQTPAFFFVSPGSVETPALSTATMLDPLTTERNSYNLRHSTTQWLDRHALFRATHNDPPLFILQDSWRL